MTLDDVIATAQESLLQNGVPKETVAKVIRDLRAAAEEEKADRKAATGKKAKTQFVVLKVRSEDGAAINGDHLGWVLQLEDGANPADAYSRVVAAANAFNGSKKGRRVPVKTVGEALENVGAKWYKTATPTEVTHVKTRVACPILTIQSNDLPQ